MIDRENLKYYENILSLENEVVDFENVYNIVTAIKENDEYGFFKILLENTSSYNLDLLENVLKTCKHHPELKDDILDSFSDNQFRSKQKLIDMISQLSLLPEELDIIVFGSWYGSILIPGFAHRAKRISCIDLDEQVLKVAKNRLFNDLDNIDYIAADIFQKDRKRYWNADLFVNTSCEHMKPMREWPYWQNCKNNSYFAFQSNNMYDIEGHINCVDSIPEFKAQLPDFFEVYSEEEIEDSRGIRFSLVGSIN